METNTEGVYTRIKYEGDTEEEWLRHEKESW
jgi:hypothetical protein